MLVADDPATVEAEEASLTAAGFSVAARVVTGPEATRAVDQHPRAIVILAVDLDDADGVGAVREAASRHPELRVIAYTGRASRECLDDALAAGAAAVVKKSRAPADLVSAVTQLVWGRTIFFGDGAARRPARRKEGRPGGLTTREVEVLALVAAGWTNAAVADGVSITEQTVKFHLSNIFRKLGVANRTAASRWFEAHISVAGTGGDPRATAGDRACEDPAFATLGTNVYRPATQGHVQEENAWRVHLDHLPPEPTGESTPRPPSLSDREREVLALVADGRSNAEVGRVLWITEETVKFHLSNVFRKLGVSTRTEAARWAHAYRLSEGVRHGDARRSRPTRAAAR